jgi:uncharacterized protein YdaU (DUF1376 family)
VNKPPAFQFYVDDYLGSLDVRRMTARQELAYLRLLIHLWAADGCKLVDDPAILAHISRMSPREWEKESGPVMAKFNRRHGKIFNTKLRRQWEELGAFREAQRLSGKQGGINSGLARKRALSDPASEHEAKRTSPSPSPSPPPSPTLKQQQQNRTTDKLPETATAPPSSAAAVQQPDIDAKSPRAMHLYLSDLGFPDKLALVWSADTTPRQLWAAAKASRTKDNPNGYMRALLEKGHALPSLAGHEEDELRRYLQEHKE